MGAKKKKATLANRLARMSDEDRAKYMQRKADAEEEARRRKEHLMSTFMKNKMKREEAFSRLNLAKINQQYHQNMRLKKCKKMKEDVGQLQIAAKDFVDYRNANISRLKNEYNWQEELYVKNFNSHSNHIDDFHNNRLDELKERYEHDKKLLLHIGKKERNEFQNQAENMINHMKTMIYGQEDVAKKDEFTRRQRFMTNRDELISTYKMELSEMSKGREVIVHSLWKQIFRAVRSYVQRGDARRSHLAELQRLDIEGGRIIADNQKTILEKEEELEKLQSEFRDLNDDRKEHIKLLKISIENATRNQFLLRKNLESCLRYDEKQISLLADVSQDSIRELDDLRERGKQIIFLTKTCKKLETKLETQDKCSETTFVDKSDASKSSNSAPESLLSSTSHISLDVESIPERTRMTFEAKTQIRVPRPKTGATQDKIHSRGTYSSNGKTRAKSCSISSKCSETSVGNGDEFKTLEKLENFWSVYNKAEMDRLLLKNRRKQLVQRNIQLKEHIREVLEQIALGETCSTSFITSSKKRIVASAPSEISAD